MRRKRARLAEIESELEDMGAKAEIYSFFENRVELEKITADVDTEKDKEFTITSLPTDQEYQERMFVKKASWNGSDYPIRICRKFCTYWFTVIFIVESTLFFCFTS